MPLFGDFQATLIFQQHILNGEQNDQQGEITEKCDGNDMGHFLTFRNIVCPS
jgi:hypothetical protein